MSAGSGASALRLGGQELNFWQDFAAPVARRLIAVLDPAETKARRPGEPAKRKGPGRAGPGKAS